MSEAEKGAPKVPYGGGCIFCSIVEGKIKSKRVYEDQSCVAFLDIRPRCAGMTIVAPKRHFESLDSNPEEASKVLQSCVAVSKMLRQALEVEDVNIAVIKSPEIKHFHVRLYPTSGMPTVSEAAPIEISEEELDMIAQKVSAARPRQEEKKSESGEKEWDADDAKYIRRHLESA